MTLKPKSSRTYDTPSRLEVHFTVFFETATQISITKHKRVVWQQSVPAEFMQKIDDKQLFADTLASLFEAGVKEGIPKGVAQQTNNLHELLGIHAIVEAISNLRNPL